MQWARESYPSSINVYQLPTLCLSERVERSSTIQRGSSSPSFAIDTSPTQAAADGYRTWTRRRQGPHARREPAPSNNQAFECMYVIVPRLKVENGLTFRAENAWLTFSVWKMGGTR